MTRKSGITLIELLVCMAILAIVATMVVGFFKDRKALKEMATMETTVEAAE